MKLHNLESTEGSRHSKKRVGRGIGSGLGKTAGRGQKGQKARSGGKVRIGFEGGQNPIYLRLPKRGFHNFNQKKVAELTINKLNKLDFSDINQDTLLKNKVIKGKFDLIKIIGSESVSKKFDVKVHAISTQAKAQIEKAGGKVTLLAKNEQQDLESQPKTNLDTKKTIDQAKAK